MKQVQLNVVAGHDSRLSLRSADSNGHGSWRKALDASEFNPGDKVVMVSAEDFANLTAPKKNTTRSRKGRNPNTKPARKQGRKESRKAVRSQN